MNREEFLTQLRAELRDFSEEEREEALKFYREYLDEAGPENEGVVIAELGSPEKVARIIRANMPGAAQRKSGKSRIHLTLEVPDWRAPKAPDPVPRADEPEEEEDGPAPVYAQPEPPAPADGAAKDRRILWIILLALTCPVWLGLAGGIFGGIVGILGGLCGLAVAGFGTMIAGFAVLGASVGILFAKSLGSGLLMMGLSLLCVAAGAVFAALAIWAVAKLVPALLRLCKRLLRAVLGKVRNAG